ncbi:MAG: hypothetical protein ACYSWZ_00385 [Planctomycetota bacterium]|jgi:hypothetical protein
MAVKIEIIRELVEAKSWTDSQVSKMTTPYKLPMEWRIEYEERAAILEYDGGLSRDEADRRAFAEILRRQKKL